MSSSGSNKRLQGQTKLSAFFKPIDFPARSPKRPKPNPPSRPGNDNETPTLLNRESTLESEFDSLTTSAASDSQSTRRNKDLASVASETKTLLPDLLKTLPSAPPDGCLYVRAELDHLDPKFCPRFTTVSSGNIRHGTPIRVVDGDTFDVAISLSQEPVVRDKQAVCVLNMANAYHGGGGWLKGALAQEEALCYRSSLSFTLKRKFYPLPEISGVYSPTVVVMRKSMADGHGLLDLTNPDDLPVLSAISVAAVRDPPVTTSDSEPPQYRQAKDRSVMKSKMRMVLRIAAFNGHRRLVLGALGCGAFNNPREEVAGLWAEVLSELEFCGGWWEKIVFAVMDTGVDGERGKDGSGNYGVFYRLLDGLIV